MIPHHVVNAVPMATLRIASPEDQVGFAFVLLHLKIVKVAGYSFRCPDQTTAGIVDRGNGPVHNFSSRRDEQIRAIIAIRERLLHVQSWNRDVSRLEGLLDVESIRAIVELGILYEGLSRRDLVLGISGGRLSSDWIGRRSLAQTSNSKQYGQEQLHQAYCFIHRGRKGRKHERNATRGLAALPSYR